jgi:hypothetical protein
MINNVFTSDKLRHATQNLQNMTQRVCEPLEDLIHMLDLVHQNQDNAISKRI